MAVKVLTKDEVGRLLAAPDRRTRRGRRDVALLSVMTLGGLRIAEACGLRRDEVSDLDGIMRLTFSGKGDKLRTVTLPAPAANAVRRTLGDYKGTPYVFPGRCHKHALSPNGGWRVATTYFRALGFKAWVHPHSLRHTCATMLLRATNGDMRTVQRTLGHASPSTTAKHYDGWDSTDTDRAAAALERYL